MSSRRFTLEELRSEPVIIQQLLDNTKDYKGNLDPYTMLSILNFLNKEKGTFILEVYKNKPGFIFIPNYGYELYPLEQLEYPKYFYYNHYSKLNNKMKFEHGTFTTYPLIREYKIHDLNSNKDVIESTDLESYNPPLSLFDIRKNISKFIPNLFSTSIDNIEELDPFAMLTMLNHLNYELGEFEIIFKESFEGDLLFRPIFIFIPRFGLKRKISSYEIELPKGYTYSPNNGILCKNVVYSIYDLEIQG